jgi:hypothetical protein
VSGDHKVMVYPDPLAGQWSPPLASNAYFTNDLTGWVQGPFGIPWVWHPGGYADGSLGMNRDENHPVPRNMDVTAYRVRATVTLHAPQTNLTFGLYYGTTPNAAWAGPFWEPEEAAEQLTWNGYAPGTYALEATFDPAGIDPRYGFIGPVIYSWGDDAPTFTITSLELAHQLSTNGIDISCLVDTVSINHGRDDTSSQPEASSATINLTASLTDPLPPEVDVGASVVVTTATGDTVSQRFVGRVTDMTLGWEESGDDTPDHGVGQIVAVSILSDLGRRVVGDEPWPQELDGARVARVMDAAGVPLDPFHSDPGVADLIARDVDARAALEVAHAAAASAFGVVWQTRDGEVRYADANHRRGVQPTLTLDSCELLVTPQWRRTTEGLTNSVSIGYGVAPEGEEGGEAPRYEAESPNSIARWGKFAYSSTTELAEADDAALMAETILARNSQPVWVMASLPVDVPSLDVAQYDALLTLDMHSLVVLTGLPSLGRAPTNANMWVEGFTETLSYGTHDFTLTVSGYCRTAPAPAWDEIHPDTTWDSVSPSITWDDASCFGGPPVNLGRWNDAPATLRWDQLDPAETWDTYTPSLGE